MNASYFLFVELEQARNIAQARGQQEAQRATVLTGMPVAGMVYLDRPSPAGYFIFPDLSVRHEGRYRLKFSLFEQTKEAKDEDIVDSGIVPHGMPYENGYITHRLEVYSQTFTVFSAKKFPGLAESTSLSRIVAEQGCRVRIRRDVRMRRRDNKSSKDWDGYEEETTDMRARLSSATPEASAYHGHGYMDPIQRPRSGSNASHPSLAPSLSRRASLQDINQGFHQPSYGTAPHTPQNAYPQSSPYISGPSPIHSYGPPQFVQQQSSMQPPPPGYHSHSHQPPAALPMPTSHQNYYSCPPAPSPSYEGSLHPYRRSGDYSPQVQGDYRRPSSMYAAPAAQTLPQPGYAAAPIQHTYQSQPGQQSTYQHTNTWQPSYPGQHVQDGYGARPAPTEPPARTSGVHTPLSNRTFSDKLPPLNTSFNVTSVKAIDPASPASSVPQPSHYGAVQAPESNKRNYSQVFNEQHLKQPLRQGARPITTSYGNDNLLPLLPADGDQLEEAGTEYENPSQMSYRRANGRKVYRNLPPHIE